jgi:hypothetical protein
MASRNMFALSRVARSRWWQFGTVEGSFRGNFILTTQPMNWEPPRTASVYLLQPLRPDQISTFLFQQWAVVGLSAAVSKTEYVEVEAAELDLAPSIVW